MDKFILGYIAPLIKRNRSAIINGGTTRKELFRDITIPPNLIIRPRLLTPTPYSHIIVTKKAKKVKKITPNYKYWNLFKRKC